MSNIRQYFDTDFDHALRVNIGYPASTIPCVGALFYDPTASCSFLAFYFDDSTLQPQQFEAFLATISYGTTQVTLQGGVVPPSLRVFHGGLRVHNSNPFKIEYQFFGDPSWHDLLAVTPSRRVFIYAETSFSQTQLSALQAAASGLGHQLQFRDSTYANERTIREKPLAFISHDSRDKETSLVRLRSTFKEKYALFGMTNFRCHLEQTCASRLSGA